MATAAAWCFGATGRAAAAVRHRVCKTRPVWPANWPRLAEAGRGWRPACACSGACEVLWWSRRSRRAHWTKPLGGRHPHGRQCFRLESNPNPGPNPNPTTLTPNQAPMSSPREQHASSVARRGRRGYSQRQRAAGVARVAAARAAARVAARVGRRGAEKFFFIFFYEADEFFFIFFLKNSSAVSYICSCLPAAFFQGNDRTGFKSQ